MRTPTDLTDDTDASELPDMGVTTLASLDYNVRELTRAVRALVAVISPRQFAAAAQMQMKTLSSLGAACANLAKQMETISEANGGGGELDPAALAAMFTT